MKINFVVTEIAHLFLLPPTSLFLLMAVGWVVQRRRPRIGKAISAIGLAALIVLCTEAGARLLIYPLEQLTVPLASASGQGAQAIVVLAAGRLASAPEYAGRDIPDYIALARLRYAAKLQHATDLPVLVSGGSGDEVSEPHAVTMARALREDFRTPVKWVEGKSDNTEENADFSANILKQAGVKRILLVTDAMHMPRARRVFARNDLEVIAAPTMFFSSGRLTPAEFLPSPEGLRRSHYAVYEWIGLVWYRLREVAG
jgi:uncharacterized SAM-binding protein YcdF (DUF218 family)